MMLLQLKGEHSHAPVACFLVSGPGLKPCCEDQRKRDGTGDEGVLATGTVRASLSGTFLQTLPDLVTPLKGHSILSAGSCPVTRSAPSERFGY